MTLIIPVTQARKDFLNLVDKINDEYTRVDITKKGQIKVSMVSPDYLDSLEETIYSLEHSMGDVRAAEKEISEGKYVTLEEFLNKFHAGKKIHHSAKGRKKSK